MRKGLNGALLPSLDRRPEVSLHTSELEFQLPSQMHHQTNGRIERSQSFESRPPLVSSFVSRFCQQESLPSALEKRAWCHFLSATVEGGRAGCRLIA
jgi:hypothetical protein